jgi:hypothetical protein
VKLPPRDEWWRGALALALFAAWVVSASVLKGEQESLGERVEYGLKAAAVIAPVVSLILLGWWWASKDD